MKDFEDTPRDKGMDSVPGLAGQNRECQPSTDLWPGIEQAIRARRARAWRAPLWAGAALAASLVLTLTFSLPHRGARSRPLKAPAGVAAAQLAQAHAAALFQVVNHPLHPETRALVRANLKIVNNAETQLKRALAEDPDGEYLKSLLAIARNQQAQLVALEAR